MNHPLYPTTYVLLFRLGKKPRVKTIDLYLISTWALRESLLKWAEWLQSFQLGLAGVPYAVTHLLTSFWGIDASVPFTRVLSFFFFHLFATNLKRVEKRALQCNHLIPLACPQNSFSDSCGHSLNLFGNSVRRFKKGSLRIEMSVETVIYANVFCHGAGSEMGCLIPARQLL